MTKPIFVKWRRLSGQQANRGYREQRMKSRAEKRCQFGVVRILLILNPANKIFNIMCISISPLISCICGDSCNHVQWTRLQAR